MKVKTARRFVARNRWKAVVGSKSPSFIRRYTKCLRITKHGEDILMRKY